MRKGWLWVILIGVAIILIGLIVGLYLLGGDDQSPLERLRDISIVFITVGLVMVVLLNAILVGVGVWVALLIKDNVIPLLEQLTATATRARGTAAFVSEEVAKPVISTYSTVAGLRAMIKTVTQGVKPKRGAQGPHQQSPDSSETA